MAAFSDSGVSCGAAKITELRGPANQLFSAVIGGIYGQMRDRVHAFPNPPSHEQAMEKEGYAFIYWSDKVTPQRPRGGKKLADYINHIFPNTVHCSEVRTNPNTKNQIQFYVWTVPQEEVKAYMTKTYTPARLRTLAHRYYYQRGW